MGAGRKEGLGERGRERMEKEREREWEQERKGGR